MPVEAVARLLHERRFEEAAELAREVGEVGDLADTLMTATGRAEFLDVDVTLARMLQELLERLPVDEAVRRSRIAAKLAYELRGDATMVDDRRALLELAASEAEKAGDLVAESEALLAAIHALWEPAGASERVRAADCVIALAQRTHDIEHEMEARLARINALVELGRVLDAGFEVAAYARLAAPLDRPDLNAFIASRRALLALLSGRYEEGQHQADLAYASALEAGMPDAERLRMTYRVMIDRDRVYDEGVVPTGLGQLRLMASRMPGHYFEITAARILLSMGQHEEARLELARGLPSLLTSSGFRWLFSACHAAEVAAVVGTDDACARLYDALLPHQDWFVVGGPAFHGTVRDRLGVLATRLGRVDEALAHLRQAVADLDAIVALPWAAWARLHLAAALRTVGDVPGADREQAAAVETALALGMTRLLAEVEDQHADAWVLRHDGDDWLLAAGEEHGRFRAARGFEHLHTLLAHPGRDVAAVELDAGDVPRERGTPMLDEQALVEYRRRLEWLAAEIESADRAGDQQRADELDTEQAALLAEVRRATGLGGRRRTTNDKAERARVNVTRNIKRALEQISGAAPLAGAHLHASIRTGTQCRYDPRDEGPRTWTLR